MTVSARSSAVCAVAISAAPSRALASLTDGADVDARDLERYVASVRDGTRDLELGCCRLA